MATKTTAGKPVRVRLTENGAPSKSNKNEIEIFDGIKVEPFKVKRILDFLNQVQIPEDFKKRIQEVRRLEEHEIHGEGDNPVTNLPLSIKIDEEQAKYLLEKRPLYGYDIKDLRLLDKGIFDHRFWEHLLELINDSMYGRMDVLFPIQAGGVTYSIEHAALLHTGKVLFVADGNTTILWDPTDETTPLITTIPGATTGLTGDPLCCGMSFMSDGKLLCVGGGGFGPSLPTAIQAWKFDPIALTWQKTSGDLNIQRWYPTVVTLGEEPGQLLVASGATAGGNQMEIYSETTDTFTLITSGGAVGEKSFPQLYPGLHLLPGGEIFYAPTGFGECSQSANAHAGSGDSGYFQFTGSFTGNWTNTGPNIRTKGMSALLLSTTYPYVRVLVIGGGTTAQSATGQIINLSTLTPTWEPEFPLLESRVHPNVVLLPDGKVFICGGKIASGTPSNGGRCEIFNPDTGTVTEMAELNYPRHYHSVAILLPSGKVMIAGGASDGGCSASVNNNIEIFSPPYLFRGPRPTISSVTNFVHHGATFTIDTPDASIIDKIVFVRPMAATHQTDTEQRVIPTVFSKTDATHLTVTAPGGAHPHGIAPRGYYMIFIVNSDGVPSVASWIYLH